MVSMLSRRMVEIDAGVVKRGRSVRVADTTTVSIATPGPVPVTTGRSPGASLEPRSLSSSPGAGQEYAVASARTNILLSTQPPGFRSNQISSAAWLAPSKQAGRWWLGADASGANAGIDKHGISLQEIRLIRNSV